MSNELVPQDAPPPAAPEREPDWRVADLTQLFLSKLTNDRFDDEPPSAGERQLLNRRRQECHSLNSPISESVAARDAARKEIAGLLSGWANLRGDPVKITNAYVAHLSDLPGYAVREAINRFRMSSVEGWDPAYVPSAPQIYEVAKDIAARLRAEEWNLSRILRATKVPAIGRQVSDEERGRVAAAAKELVQTLGDKMRVDDQRARAHAAAKTAAYQAGLEGMKRAQFESLGLVPAYDDAGVMYWPNQVPPNKIVKVRKESLGD